MPVPGYHWRGDAYTKQDFLMRGQCLNGGGGHGQQRRSADLDGKHPGTKPDPRHGMRHRAQDAERLSATNLGDPQRAIPEALSAPGQVEDSGGSGPDERRRGNPRRGITNGCGWGESWLRGIHDCNYSDCRPAMSGRNQTPQCPVHTKPPQQLQHH